jgi:hypothetical protein
LPVDPLAYTTDALPSFTLPNQERRLEDLRVTTGFETELLDHLRDVEEIEIETRPSADRPARRVIIWVVVVERSVYVRSVRGPAGRWYRNLLANPTGAIVTRGETHPVRAVSIVDAPTIAAVSAEFLRKYAASPYAPPMVRAEVLMTTLRLDPV